MPFAIPCTCLLYTSFDGEELVDIDEDEDEDDFIELDEALEDNDEE